jgi:uncharacterized protein YwgA
MKIVEFFDKLEDKIRIRLSHYPIVYAFIGAVGIILMWKGIWEMAEYFPILFGPASLIIGTLILLATGLLVSFYIGDSIILSGFRREKKFIEKTEKEIQAEEAKIDTILSEIKKIEEDVEELRANQEKR